MYFQKVLCVMINIDNLKKLGEKKLPERKYFYNKLTLKDISEQDYKHAVNTRI